ncbi:claspin [Drosophila subobscura]|uniref:claspin n=1 Tax=Drosophila subobscura TaxID=7241 RepID=UPI00155A4F6D|nr:claspin [Drosophila subobscura]
MSETVAETAAAAENDEQEDDSMETLQVEEEDEKNVSAEDLLGGKSLMMSDSDNEEEPQLASKSRRQRLLDSDEEEEQKEKSVQQKEEEQAEAQMSPISSRQRLPDTEEEAEVVNDKAGQQISSPKSSRQRFAAIDEEDEEEMAPKMRKKISALIDTDSEEEPQMAEEQPKKRKKKLTKKKKQRMDSESDGNSDSHDESQKEQSDEAATPPKNKLKGLVDSESEPEPGNDSGEEQENATEGHAEKPKKAKAMRASAKQALDNMQAIQSEQQRLHREAHISVPYHQPKPRTLKEFLSRRTINTPLATALAGGSPMPSKQPRKSLGLRMNREELEAYAKLMEERAKEATEFFKSESEGEESDEHEAATAEEMQEKPEVMDEAATEAESLNEVEQQAAETASEEITADLPMEQQQEEPQEAEPVASTSAAAAAALRFARINEYLPQPEVRECLVTEVLELPKLDLSTITATTPPSKPATPRLSEAIRRLKIEKSADVSPSLRGDATMLIDLETGDMFAKKPTGVDDLLQRLMKTREAKKHKATETVNILSTAHGKLEMSKVNIQLHEEEPVHKDAAPGAAYAKMQEQLKSRITQKRMEELRKKQAEEEAQAAEDDEEMGMDVDEDEEEEEEEYEPEEKPCARQVHINEDEEIVEEAAAAEDLLPLDEEVEELAADSSSSSESEPEAEPAACKKRNRIIKAFPDDDNSDEDDLDLLQTPKPPSNATPMTATQLQLSAHKLFEAETRRTASDEENELLDLCSGQFPQSQMASSAAPSMDTALISQIPMTQFGLGSSQAPEELEALCSGSFATQQGPTQQPEEVSQPQQIANKIVSSDEEQQQLATDKPRNKKLTKKKPKKRALGFSDDEESEVEECEEELEEEEQQLEEPLEEIPETFVDYDSEENEILVEMTKKDRNLRASNYVEKEAELSESEWGSADEDENNMDTYDIELGDEDEFDKEKLRSELGQIHARKMLDQDIREVRKIKEMLFEDDEGAVRQRQFRWKNVDSGFSLEDQQRPENGGEGNGEGSGDEENEHMWRKIRYEREQLLLENGLKAEAATPLSPAGNAFRRLNIITAKKTTVEVKKSSPFLISKGATGGQQKSTVRGSFLVRDSETLSKLAGMTKGRAGQDGTAGTVSTKAANSKNFVFATLTEEEHENQKRKAADLLNSSSETGVNFMKKPRLEPRREKCLIDQLL